MLIGFILVCAASAVIDAPKNILVKRRPPPTVTAYGLRQTGVPNPLGPISFPKGSLGGQEQGKSGHGVLKTKPQFPPPKRQRTHSPNTRAVANSYTTSPMTNLGSYMFPGLNTVNEVWQEYKYGFPGYQSILSLEQKYGLHWFTSESDAYYYYGRKLICDYIQVRINNGADERTVVANLEKLRVDNTWTLDQLQQKIEQSNKSHTRPSVASTAEYKLMPNLTTVGEVWQEYKYGLNGNPSVESLVNDQRIIWPTTESELNFYRSRKMIYDFIERMMKGRKTESEAVKLLEERRIQKNYSLIKLQQAIYHLSKKNREKKQPPMPNDDLSTYNEIWGDGTKLQPPKDKSENALFAEIWNNRNAPDPSEEAQFAEFLRQRNATNYNDEPYSKDWADEETDSPYGKLWDSWQ